MYSPVKDGIEKTIQSVHYAEAKPPDDLSGLVHSFWELKTKQQLSENFFLHVLPDACVNILFNQVDTRIAGITTTKTTFKVLNLGKHFHYAGIQFLPGVWQGRNDETTSEYVGTDYTGALPLIETNKQLAELNFDDKQARFSKLVYWLIDKQLVTANLITEKILKNLDSIHNVADMAAITDMSTRQLQRVLKKITGFSPHDFLKVLRLQQSFKQDYLISYTDQSHFIRSFRKITGYTPNSYMKKFGV